MLDVAPASTADSASLMCADLQKRDVIHKTFPHSHTRLSTRPLGKEERRHEVARHFGLKGPGTIRARFRNESIVDTCSSGISTARSLRELD
jgi:hypothetical protein